MMCLFVGWGLVSMVGWFLPAKYRSETLILVEQQRVPEHYVEPNIALDLQQRLQSMSEQILSRTRLMSIIDKFHLYGNDPHADGDAVVERMRKDIGIELVRGEKVDQISAFKVSYSANTPVVAQQVTAELTSLFIEENLKNRVELSEDTTGFLETQLDDARKNLAQQELRLKEFKSKYLGQLPEQTASNLQILAGLQTRLQGATDALSQAEQQRLYLESLSAQYRAMRTTTGAENPQPLNATVLDPDQKLQQLKAEEAELEAKYTSLHPDVVRLKEEIAATEKLKTATQQAGEQEKPAKNSADTPQLHKAVTPAELQTLTPILQVESQKKANELEIANRKAEIKKIQTDIDTYQERLNLAPAREQELANLTRDHEQSRASYESLLAKKNQSEMATNLEKRQQGEQFRMIDPPSLPQKPYFPNRLSFSIAGLVFGLGLGAAIVIALEVVNPRLYGDEELSAVLTAPVLVTIPPLATAAETRKKMRYRAFEWATAIVMLVTIPAVTLLIYRRG